MPHAAGEMHPPTSAHEMRAAPGAKSWKPGCTTGCSDSTPNADDGSRSAHRASTQAIGSLSWHEVDNHHRHVELAGAVRGEESVPVVIHDTAWR